MRMAVLQHVPFEGPAAIADWASRRSVPLDVFHVYRGSGLPQPDSFDMLTVMGGPMSANDTATLPWLQPEIDLVRDAMAGGKIVLGVCLGSQIIAKALGAPVYAAKQREIGWFPVTRTADAGGATLFDALPSQFTPFHWHGETFDLPAGAVRLAETADVPNQAFQIGDRVLGLQFHMEATPQSVADLVKHAGHEIADGPFEQPPHEILAESHRCADIEPLLDHVLDALTGLRPDAGMKAR